MVAAFSLEVNMTLGHDTPLFLPICGTVFVPREVTLCALHPLSLVG
jgi:hypothetical protein